jgi:hypothetical protein
MASAGPGANQRFDSCKAIALLLILELQPPDHDNLKVRRWHYDDVMMNASDTHHDTINIMIMIIFVVVIMTS